MTLELCAPTERYRLGAPLCTVPFGDGWNRTHQLMVILIDFGDCFLLGLQHYHEVGKIVSGKPWLWEYHGSMTCMMGMGQALSMEEIKYWLVVYLPLWKIWVRQLGWVFPTEWKVIKAMFQTTNQNNYTCPNKHDQSICVSQGLKAWPRHHLRQWGEFILRDFAMTCPTALNPKIHWCIIFLPEKCHKSINWENISHFQRLPSPARFAWN